MAQIVTTANISCAGVNSLPDAAGGRAAVLHGLQAGASGLDLRWLRFEPRSVNAADANHLQMALAANSPLLITERGTLWTDGVGMARISSGKQTVVMHKKNARGKVLHEDVSTCEGLLVRGSCVERGEDPYPRARVPCFELHVFPLFSPLTGADTTYAHTPNPDPNPNPTVTLTLTLRCARSPLAK